MNYELGIREFLIHYTIFPNFLPIDKLGSSVIKQIQQQEAKMDPEQIILSILDRGIADLTNQLGELGPKADQVIADLSRLNEETTALEPGLEEIEAVARAIRSN